MACILHYAASREKKLEQSFKLYDKTDESLLKHTLNAHVYK